MNSRITREKLADGSTLAQITLIDGYKRWVGDVRLEYGVRENGKAWGRYFSITDFGNYSYAWFHIGDESFEHFIFENAFRDQDYMMNKLTSGHEENHMFKLDRSKQYAHTLYQEYVAEAEKPPTAGERNTALDMLDEVRDQHDLMDWYEEYMQESDGYDYFVYGRSSEADGYQANVLPLLAEVLEAANDEASE